MVLKDYKQRILSYLKTDVTWTYDEIVNALRNPFLKPRFKIVILNPDETEVTEIDECDIVEGSISYNEKYQKGERRSLSFTLINKHGKYTPSSNIKNIRYINNGEEKNVKNLITRELWADTLFAYYVGFEYLGKECWFKKCVYIINNISITGDSEQTIAFSLSDKFAKFTGKQGVLMDTYEVPVGSNGIRVIKDLLNMSNGNGYNFDIQPFIYDSRFADFKIQASIQKESGDTISSIIDDIATQMSANYYYNDNGNFVFEYLDETINDNMKTICWTFSEEHNELFNLNMEFDFTNAINIVKVVGDNVDKGIYSALVVNNDPRSPICTGRIGNRKEPPITNCNVWNDNMARELGIYHLRKKSLLPLSLNGNCKFNPFLQVDKLCIVNYEQLNYQNEKCILHSFSYNSNDFKMSIQMTNVQDLDFLRAGSEYNGI